jgi:hypothetical protein
VLEFFLRLAGLLIGLTGRIGWIVLVGRQSRRKRKGRNSGKRQRFAAQLERTIHRNFPSRPCNTWVAKSLQRLFRNFVNDFGEARVQPDSLFDLPRNIRLASTARF